MKMNLNSFIFISVLVNKYNTDRETTGLKWQIALVQLKCI